MGHKLQVKNKSLKKHYALVLFNLANVIVIVGVLSQSLKANLYGVATNMDYIVARKTLGGHDSGSYLEGSMQLLGISEKNELNDFVWQLWPPGMPFILFLLSKIGFLFQHALFAGVIIQVVSVLVIQNNLRLMLSVRSAALSYLFPVFFLAIFSPYRDWILGYGLLYAEGPALAFLTSSVVVLHFRERILNGSSFPHSLRNFELTEKWLLFIAGALFAFSAYFRGPFDTMIQGCLIVWILVICWKKLSGNLQKNIGTPIIFFATYFVFTLPWRIYSFLEFKIAIFRWTSLSGDANWAYISHQELVNNGQEAWAYGNLNWACELIPSECGRAARHTIGDLVGVILTNPVDFLVLRIPQFVKTLALPGSELYPFSGKFNYAQSAIWLITISIVSVLFLRLLIQNKLNFINTLFLSSIFSTVVLILVTHFESRYFLPATLFMIMFLGSFKRLNASNY